MPHYLFLIRGLPGSGKTTLVEKLDAMPIATDDYFYDKHNNYNFNPKLLNKAHKHAQERAQMWLDKKINVAVHNTMSRKWEAQPYIDMAEKAGATIIIIDLFDAGLSDEELHKRNSHGVPIHTINNMRNRWEVF